MIGRKNEGDLEVNIGSETGIERDISETNAPIGRIITGGGVSGTTIYGVLNQVINKVSQYGSKSEVLIAIFGAAVLSGVAALGAMNYIHRRYEERNGQRNYSSEQEQ